MNSLPVLQADFHGNGSELIRVYQEMGRGIKEIANESYLKM